MIYRTPDIEKKMMKSKVISVEYDRKNSNSEKFDSRNQYGNQAANIDFLEGTHLLSQELQILEIGCGCGGLLSHLRSQGLNAIGVEINREKVERGQEIYGPQPIEIVNSEVLPFEDNSFDIVLSFDVFEHIPDSDGHLQEVARVLKPGGYYLLQTPNRITNVVFETIRWKSFTSWRSDHCSLHDYWGLNQRFTKNSFTKPQFYDIPIVTDFFKTKIKRYLGPIGLVLLKLVNPDKLPLWLRTNFYVQTQKN